MASAASWDRRPSVQGQQPPPPPQQQTLPPIAALNGSAPPGERDSGNWSLTSNSQRASNISEISQPPLTLPPIESHTRNSPGENANGHHYPTGQSPVSTNFGASSTSLHHGTSPGNNGHYGHHGHDSGVLPTPSPTTSRRSSFDSRLGNLNIASPIGGTPTASQVSLSSTLLNSNRDSLASQMQRERGIHSNSPLPAHDSSPNLPHYNSRPNETGLYATSRANPIPGRTAPPIIPIKQYSSSSTAAIPTKGMPWAFPDPDIALDESRASHESHAGARGSQTSLPGSAASSMYSTNMHAGGQIPSIMEVNGHHLPRIQDTHHHGLGPRRSGSVISHSDQATPYSRTPELRVSHKLAERKRRKEMKDLFDELRDCLPAERGGKSSKWEVLTKAIEFVNQLKSQLHDKDSRMERMQQQLDQYQKDVDALRQELQHHRHVQQHQQAQHQQQNYRYTPQGAGKMQGLEVG